MSHIHDLRASAQEVDLDHIHPRLHEATPLALIDLAMADLVRKAEHFDHSD